MNVIVTGVTGMVGEGVLQECLKDPGVQSVLIINRKESGFTHSKLKEIVHKDFFDLSSVRTRLAGYDACLFCLGVSSIGMKEPEYTRMTYDLTMHFAETVSALNSKMTFCYISGASTDSTEKGRLMWARVKGKTENDLMKLPFRKAFAFRPGLIKSTPGLKNTGAFYKYVSWIFPIAKIFSKNAFVTMEELGKAMIKVCKTGYSKNIIEVSDIRKLGN